MTLWISDQSTSHSVLLGVPTVIIGFRQDNGVLAGFQSFETLDIPRLLVSPIIHITSASVCFADYWPSLVLLRNHTSGMPHPV